MIKKLAIVALVIVSLISCHDDPTESTACSTRATVKDLSSLDGCGFVFELEDGTRLQPLRIVFFCRTPPVPKEFSDDPLKNFEFVEGKVVNIDYEIIETVSTCMAGPIVRITCISEARTLHD